MTYKQAMEKAQRIANRKGEDVYVVMEVTGPDYGGGRFDTATDEQIETYYLGATIHGVASPQ